MQEPFEGSYFCSVRYHRRGQLLTFTRRLDVTSACELLRPDTPLCQLQTPLPATP